MPLNVSPSEKQELAVVYASLILHDDKAAITAENIQKIVDAAGITVEPYWPKLFASLLEGKDVGTLLVSSGGGGGGAAPAAAGAAGAASPAGGAKKEEKKEEKKKEKSEESGADMGFSLFD